MRYAILTPAQLTSFRALAKARASIFARRADSIGRRVRKTVESTYRPGARGWTVPWAEYYDPRDGTTIVAAEDAFVDALPRPDRNRFAAAEKDLRALLAHDHTSR